MPVPPIPPPLENLGQRPFSFYPPILGIEHNEWQFRKAAWSEVLVVNTKDASEIWVPRVYLGEISRIDEPVMILGLTKELELRAGQILPHVRRVIEMPRAVNDQYRPAAADVSEPASVVGIKLEDRNETSIGKLILIVMMVGIIGCVLLVSLFRDGQERVSYRPVLQSELGLAGTDDYFAVVRKLGAPAEDRWLSDKGEMQYRVLRYPKEAISVVLMGPERDKALYIGSVDSRRRPVHSVSLPGGRDTQSLLRNLPAF